MDAVYLDYNATTPLDPDIAEAMREVEGRYFGNPSSQHQLGRAARALLDECRERVATVWRCRPGEVVFTASATESNNLALMGLARNLQERGKHLICSPLEHPAVRKPLEWLAKHEGFELTLLPVDDQGRVDPDDLRAALRPDTVLVSVQAANNEFGLLQPVAELGAVCREAGVCFHCDAVQWFGKAPFARIHDFGAHLVAACAHKLHGPKGCGALFVEAPRPLTPVLHGGSQEGDRRPGTENLPAILGLTLTMERFVRQPVFDPAKLLPLRARLENFLGSIPDVHVLAANAPRLCNTVACAVEHCDSLSLVAGLDLEGLCVSGGSACSSGALQRSRVLEVLRSAHPEETGLLRISLGRDTTTAELAALERALPDVIKRSASRQ